MEPAFSRIEPLIEMLCHDLKIYLDLPCVFFGYSMGALIAFELTRMLQSISAPIPSHLFLAARRGPRMPGSSVTGALTDRQFVDELKCLGGAPEAILQFPEMMEMMLPTLRADFSLCESYQYSPGPLLECPIHVFGGSEDLKIAQPDLAAWAGETRSSFNVKLFEGGHFFLHNSHNAIVSTIVSAAFPRPLSESGDSAPIGMRTHMPS